MKTIKKLLISSLLLLTAVGASATDSSSWNVFNKMSPASVQQQRQSQLSRAEGLVFTPLTLPYKQAGLPFVPQTTQEFNGQAVVCYKFTLSEKSLVVISASFNENTKMLITLFEDENLSQQYSSGQGSLSTILPPRTFYLILNKLGNTDDTDYDFSIETKTYENSYTVIDYSNKLPLGQTVSEKINLEELPYFFAMEGIPVMQYRAYSFDVEEGKTYSFENKLYAANFNFGIGYYLLKEKNQFTGDIAKDILELSQPVLKESYVGVESFYTAEKTGNVNVLMVVSSASSQEVIYSLKVDEADASQAPKNLGKLLDSAKPIAALPYADNGMLEEVVQGDEEFGQLKAYHKAAAYKINLKAGGALKVASNMQRGDDRLYLYRKNAAGDYVFLDEKEYDWEKQNCNIDYQAGENGDYYLIVMDHNPYYGEDEYPYYDHSMG